MIQAVPLSAYDYVSTRLQEFVARGTPWSRRLWSVGSLVELREALEAADLFADGHLRQQTFQEIRASARDTACADPGVGDGDLRNHLRRLLDRGLGTRRERDQLAHIIDRAAAGYLGRWGAEMVGAQPETLEAAARSIGSHLFDCGFSSAHLRVWLQATLAEVQTLPELLDAAEEQAGRDPHPYELLVPFSRLSLAADQELPAGWLDGPAAGQWLRSNGNRGVRQVGAFVLKTRAMDPWSAAAAAADQLDRVMARVAVGMPIGTLRAEPIGVAFIRGKDRAFDLAGPSSDLEVHALGRQSVVLSLDHDTRLEGIDFAIELAAPLARQPTPNALPAAWAAIEALLGPPDEGAHTAALAAGAILACSWPRAELTTLAFANPQGSAPLTAALADASTNLQRCRAVADAIRNVPTLTFTEPKHECSLERMRQVQANPSGVLGRVETYLSRSFLRLYRQRNHLMHAGHRRSAPLDATLRTTPILVGAVLDRVVHAFVSEGLLPARLAARAVAELRLTGTPGGRPEYELLEPA